MRRVSIHRVPRPLLGLLPALVLGACASLPAPQAPVPPSPPAGWQTGAVAEAASPGPQDAPAAGHDPALHALQARALAANRDLAQAALRWQQARRLAEQGALRLQPSLGATASTSQALERGAPAGAQAFGVSASVGYELELWGRLAQADAATRAQAEAAGTDIAAARALLLGQVAERYWTAAAHTALRASALAQLQLAEQIVALTTLRVREGKLLPVEIDRVSAAALADRARADDSAAALQLQGHQLALLLDLPLPGPALDAAQLPLAAPPALSLAPPADVLARRPDVQRARLAVDAALARLRATEADRYPRLSFSAGLGSGGDALQRWLSQPLATLAAQLVVPMVDWRLLDLQRDAARTELELAALALRDTLARSLAEVEAQLIERQRLQQQQAALAARLAELAEAERLAEVRLAAGSIGRLDLLQARRARLGGEQEQTQLQLRRWLNHLALHRALGLEPGRSGPEAGP